MSARESVHPISNPVGVGPMLSWIRRVVGFGTRRPGYAQSLNVENWLEAHFREFGLQQVRREPVPVNYWEPSVTSLTAANGVFEVPCFPVPYTAWTPPTGIEAQTTLLHDDTDFQRIDLQGRIAVLEAHFAQLTGATLKQRAFFLRDTQRSMPDGPLHAANWLIPNFAAYYEAQKRGAAGFIGLLVDSPIDGCEFYVPYDGHLKGLPGVWVGREHAERLRAAAQAQQVVRLLSVGENRLVNSHNVVGVIPGTGAEAGAENENIILTCHHDAPFASAVEDASGLAVLLALANEFAGTRDRLRRDLVIVASSGHFHGGIGNRVLVERHSAGLLRKTIAAFGVEHIAQEAEPDSHGGYRLTGRPEVRALFFDGSRAFTELLAQESARQELDRIICTDAYSFGPEPPCDSAPFFTAGIPSACLISGPLYLFDPQDTVDKVRTADLVAVARFFAQAIRRVDALSAADLAKGMNRSRGLPLPTPPPWFRPPS